MNLSPASLRRDKGPIFKGRASIYSYESSRPGNFWIFYTVFKVGVGRQDTEIAKKFVANVRIAYPTRITVPKDTH